MSQDVCYQAFSKPGNFQKHELIMVLDAEEKPFSCLTCDKKFTKQGVLKVNDRTHTGEQPFACSICDKKFTKRGSLKVHDLTHTGEKQKVTSKCHETFSIPGENLYACSNCDKKFFPILAEFTSLAKTFTQH